MKKMDVHEQAKLLGYTEAEIRAIMLDGTVSSVHNHLRTFTKRMNTLAKKKGISNVQLTMAMAKAFTQEAFLCCRFYMNLEQALKQMSKFVNDEAQFQQTEGWIKGPLLP